MEQKTDLKSMTLPELSEAVAAMGEKSFRAGQLFQWMHQKLAEDYEEMTNLPKSFRKKLEEQGPLTRLTLVERLVSRLDGTEKYLFALPDGNVIESVLMRYRHGNSVVHLHPGGLPHGMPVLRLHPGRAGEKPPSL